MKYIKKILLLFCLVNTFSALAQTNYEDVVYLKNGSIIHGIIIEQIPNKTIKIQTKDKNVFVYKIDEIEKITKEEVVLIDGKNNSRRAFNNKKSGYINITELHYGIDSEVFGINNINAILINPYFSLGLGVGYNFEQEQLPVFADLRVNFLDRKITPFFALDAGYTFSTGSNSYYKGGLLIEPNLGSKFFVSNKTALILSLGYRLQNWTYRNNSYTFTDNYYNTFVVKIGVAF